MMVQFSKDVLERMQAKAKAVRQSMQRGVGGDFSRYADLSGKAAIVAEGDTVEIRALPRWDFFGKRYMSKAGKLIENPKYVREEAWFPAFEHWFDSPQTGRRARVWCRKNLGEDEPCPVCEAAATLRGGDGEDRKTASGLRQKEVFLYNIVLRAALYKEDGTLDIRIFRAPGTVFTKIIGLCTGQKKEDDDSVDEKYALGDVTDPFEGYDLAITRPLKDSNDRYDVTAAKKPSRFCEKAEEPKWGKWPERLWDLERDVMDNVQSYEEIGKLLYGEKAGSSAGRLSDPPGEQEIPFDSGPGDAGGSDSAEDAGPFGDIGMPGEAEAPSPSSARPASRPAGRGRR